MRCRTCVLGLIIAGLVLGSVGALFAQGPTAAIVVEAFSPQEIHDLGWDLPPSNGLKVVGQGELVYLVGQELTGQTINSYAWSILEKPEGSQPVLAPDNARLAQFVPDTTGEYVIRLEITTDSGSAADTVTIVSAHYVGVGTIAGATPDYQKGQCGLCHMTKVEQWQETGHGTFFQEAIDGLKSDHYQSYCIECHTVGYNESPSAVNGGFDDVARELGWEFPAELKPGNWDSLVANFPELAQLANIQCENCHGPGSLHKGDAEKIDVSLDEGVCGKCHEEAPYHRKNLQWKRSLHAEGVGFASMREDCAGCHSGYGFVQRVDTDIQYLEEGLGEPRVTCAVCHDPHSDANPHQLRAVDPVTLENGVVVEAGGVGKLCMNCHKSRRDAVSYATSWKPHFGPHHSPQADMLAGTNAITFGMHIPKSTHLNVVEEACVTCHMAPTPGSPFNPEPATDHVGEHTFAMHWDGGTPDDPSDDYDNVVACQRCHGPITSFEDIKAKEDYDGDGMIESAQDEVKGLLEAVAMLLPPVGSPEVALEENPTEDPGYTPLQLQAAYNYLFVKDDGSYGVHNYQFAVNLLRVTYAALTTGDIGAGTIQSITDVPNDNGKQVRIVWTRFGGDGVGPLPIKYYAIWRRVDDMGKSKSDTQKKIPVYQSLASVQIDQIRPEEGARVLMNGELWDYAGSVPAAALDLYSAIAPTLFDSTKTEGMHWSVFVVSGHTDVPAIYVVSAPDSGYSVDNLAPSTPTNIVAKETEQGVELSWDEPVDEDFRYFAVYRSTSPGFDPSGMTPIGTTTEPKYVDSDVSVGTTYYYRVSAFDFAGNESPYSAEFAVLVTGVATGKTEQVPTRFVLEQNYPNPFNPSTEIVFGLPKPSYVTVVVYNLQGEAVRTLVRGQMAAGYHRLTWDGRSDNGELLSAGTYIYRLQAGDVTLTRKMVFMK